MNNKYYSNRHEKMIAEYLGWKQISGSGARPFAPGDINADQWLGECKTHDTVKDNVVFHKNQWFKICEEAYSKGRLPILFVDNGTQLSKDTWVMIQFKLIPPEIVNIIDGLKNTSIKGNTLTFNQIDTKTLYQANTVSDKVNVFKIFWDKELAVMPLETFQSFVQEWF
jgi:hypothetical protein